MFLDAKLLVRAFAPNRIAPILNSLDRSTGVIIGSCWLAAFAMLLLAFFSVRGAVSAQKEALAALASEPILPSIQNVPLAARELQSMAEQLQRQFPNIKIAVKTGQNGRQGVEIKSEDGSRFHEWITSISYVDTMAPRFHWTLQEFCVGTCTQGLMSALVTGQKSVLSVAQKQSSP